MSDDLAKIEAKLNTDGFSALSNLECLALILNDSHAPLKTASLLLHKATSLQNLKTMTHSELCDVLGIGKGRATRIQAMIELSTRLQFDQLEERPVIQKPSEVIRAIQPYLHQHKQEQFLVVLLDTHNRLIDIQVVYIGSINATVVRNAEIFRVAIQHHAVALIIVHTHPSGDSTPSPEDITFTKNLVEAGQLLDIVVLDHLILGHGEWTSLRERKLGFS